MINEEKKQILNQFLKDLSKEQVIWTSGYLAGLNADILPTTQNIKSDIEVSIIYVSETGNAKKIAGDLAVKIKQSGGKAKLKAAEQYRFADLAKETNLVFITSTHGDGEIPENGRKFYNDLIQNKPNLSALKYTILSLGDSNYPLFCQAGKIFDEEFKKLSATEFLGRTDFDLDFEDLVSDWQSAVLQALSSDGKNNSKAETKNISAPKAKKSNYQGTILKNIVLNDEGSTKEVHHLEIAAEGLKYEVGDSVAIKINNNAPRMYSVASSPLANSDEVHLTVKKVENGICSSYLSSLNEGDKIEFYISPNHNFKLPEDDKNIIMVGAGTGVAPFRGFLQERDAKNSSGKNWLFFGDQNSHTDFLYQSEWQEYLASGVLTKMDVAFSRNQQEKIYVQNRMREKSDELKNWLENGAYFYICGDKEKMAKDVEEALIQTVGEDYLNQMKTDGRYLKDVY